MMRISLLFGLALSLSIPTVASAGDADAIASAFKTSDQVRVIVFLKETAGDGADADFRNNEQRVASVISDHFGSAQARDATATRFLRRFSVKPGFAAVVSQDEYHALHTDSRIAGIGIDDFHRLPKPVSTGNGGPDSPKLVETLEITRANKAYYAGYRGAGTLVAILDTGVFDKHPFLYDKILYGACFSSTVGGEFPSQSLCRNGRQKVIGIRAGRSCDPKIDGCAHGTHVAGIAAGWQAKHFHGIATKAKLIAVQVFSKFTSEEACGSNPPCILTWDSDYFAAMEWVYKMRKRVGKRKIAAINLSLGGGNYSSYCDDADAVAQAFAELIKKLRRAKIGVAIASGNEYYNGSVAFPACLSGAITVGASDKSDEVADFSNKSPIVDLLAPGVDIRSSIPGNQFAHYSGTSMAAPHVAGALAVLRSARKKASIREIEKALKNSGPLIRQGSTERRRLDVWKALRRLGAR